MYFSCWRYGLIEMINFDRAEKAAEYLRDNAERYGQLIGHCKSLEHKRKVVFGQAFLGAEGKNIAEREAKAHVSAEFQSIVNDIQNAWAEKETLHTMIEYSKIICDLSRSVGRAGKDTDRAHL